MSMLAHQLVNCDPAQLVSILSIFQSPNQSSVRDLEATDRIAVALDYELQAGPSERSFWNGERSIALGHSTISIVWG